MANNTADLGLIGLGVMGENLALNFNDHGFKLVVYNRTASKTHAFITAAKNTAITAVYDLPALLASLAKPHKILLMVKAGAAVDALLAQLLPLLDAGDVIMDGGNSHYLDTERRTQQLAAQGVYYLGVGVSGGETGARFGPSVMPGGHVAAWPLVQNLWQTIAAHVEGAPCCQWVGENGAGHFVKMVHNGIEYGDMQLIGEAYQLLRFALGLSVDEIQAIFAEWNQGALDSYLIEITAKILTVKDDDGAPLLDKILDSAGQKGTGQWTSQAALALGVPLTLINESVFSRYLSALKTERETAARCFPAQVPAFDGDKKPAIGAIQNALYAAKIVSYAQGFMLLRQAAKEYHWQLDYGNIALMWRGGCIIRSQFLGQIKQAFSQQPDLSNLLLADFFQQAILQNQTGWRQTCQLGIEQGIALPAMMAALSFFDGYRCAQSPANLLQAQRDFFGAHTFERIDHPRGQFFHHSWPQ